MLIDAKHMILYRGSLKSCNYRCSYCPFSKHPGSKRELEKDREQWFSFVEDYRKSADRLGLGALMITPYGEAMIHSWYWQGLGRISALPGTDAVGAQTNLSFSIGEALEQYTSAGGSPEKLRIWATFHPEMTDIEEFADRCCRLRRAGVMLCAGSVGVPESIGLLKELKAALAPEDIYLWVNRQDGLGRPYTRQEEEAFLEIDPYFDRELILVPADKELCRGRLFVEGNGRLRTCNMAPVINQKSSSVLPQRIPEPVCSRKYCSCYLAYGGREDERSRSIFGSYPLFRIPCPGNTRGC